MSELRSRNFDEPESTREITFTWDDPQLGGPWTFDTHVHNKQMLVEDWVTENYKQRIALGEIINNGASIRGHEIVSQKGGQVYTTVPGGNVQTMTGEGSLISLHLDDSSHPRSPTNGSIIKPSWNEVDLVTEAKAKALANIDPSGGNYAEDVGEMGETLRFLRSPFKSMRDVAFDFRKSRKKRQSMSYSRNSKGRSNAERRRIAYADTWLQYRFAVSPIMRSIADLYVSMLVQQKTSYLRRTARGFSDFTGVTNRIETNDSGERYFTFDTTSEIFVRAYILYEDSDFIQGWRRKYGFRSKDLIRTAWDLVPFSFMTDRIFDIGTSISAFQGITDETISILAAGVVVKEESNSDIEFYQWLPNSGDTVVLSNNIRNHREKNYDRDVWAPNVFDTLPPVTLGNIVKDATYIADLSTIIYGFLR
jgi:hypothetical protein